MPGSIIEEPELKSELLQVVNINTVLKYAFTKLQHTWVHTINPCVSTHLTWVFTTLNAAGSWRRQSTVVITTPTLTAILQTRKPPNIGFALRNSIRI